MPQFYQAPGYNFKDFDLLVDSGVLYASYIKKAPQFTRPSDPPKPYNYGLAKSVDGVAWSELPFIIVPEPGQWDETIWAGGISKQNGQYVVYYTGTTLAGRNQDCQIGKIYSKDLRRWTKDPNNPVLSLRENNPFYSTEPKLAFRDPFFFAHQGKKYILFCGKDKSKPAHKQGCVGLVEEVSPSKFEWRQPIFSMETYSDGLECPALYQIQGHWYLLYGIDMENGQKAFRYAHSDSPFGPFEVFPDNQLMSSNNYTCRIVKFNGRLLMYSWYRDVHGELTTERLESPKQVHILPDGRLSVSDLE